MISHILHFSLKHRLLVVLITVAVALFGLYSLRNLPIDAVPDITNNQVQINTSASALSPVEIEKQVTYPIETALAGIPGLANTRSLSRNGFSQVTAIFDENVDIYFARQQVNERLTEAKESLPEGAEPAMGPITTGLGEIYMWTVEYRHPNGKGATIKDGQAGWQSDQTYLTPEGQILSKDYELAGYLRSVADWIIRPQMKNVKGIADIDAIGGYEQQYHVMPDPQKLITYDLDLNDILHVIEQNNRSIGAGYIEKNGEAYLVRADGRLTAMNQLNDIVVAHRNGAIIRLRDIAVISTGRELRTGSASENGQEVVVSTAMMLMNANSRLVADSVDKKLVEVNKSLPADILAKPVLNRTKLVDATISTVKKNLTEGALLVIAVLFLFLGNIRAAFITALVIPVSMLMTAIGMNYLGISGNLMSLGALDFGLIVDGAVIITENCLRRLAERQTHTGRLLTLDERLEEVFQAARDMIQPTVFGQAIIMMVYLPLLSLGGIEGKMFEPMAMTVILALAGAFILSLTFIPAMIALCVTGPVEEKENKAVHKAKQFYEPALRFGLANPVRVLAGAVTAFLVSLLVFMNMGQEFIPTLDEKDIAMHAMRIPSMSLTQSQELQSAVERILSTIPEISLVFSKTGTAQIASDPMPPNVSDTFIILKPKKEWPDPSLSKQALIARIEDTVKKIPGNNYEFTQPIQMRFNELISGVRSDVAVKLYGDEFAPMEETGKRIAQTLRTIDGAADVKVEQISGLPMLDITPDKAAISRYGLNINDVLEVISIAIGGREAGLIFHGDRRTDIVVRLPEEKRQDLDYLRELPIRLPETERKGNAPHYIPLKEVASLTLVDGPNQISRENGKRRIVVQANIRGRDIAGFVADAQEAIETQTTLPAGFWMEWDGQFKNLEEAKSRLMLVIPSCFALILLLLYTALHSSRQALLVFSGVPLALTGGILALWVRGMPFSISAAVGMIALSGVAVLNGLVLITRINQLIAQGHPAPKAVYEGALSRLRPVLMTALVASLGFLPMALASGAGAEVQKPLATVVIGGLISATFLTLLVLPSAYLRFSMSRDAQPDTTPPTV